MLTEVIKLKNCLRECFSYLYAFLINILRKCRWRKQNNHIAKHSYINNLTKNKVFCSSDFRVDNVANFKTMLLKSKKATCSTSREVTVFVTFHITHPNRKKDWRTEGTDNMIKNENKWKLREFNVFQQTLCLIQIVYILIGKERLICNIFPCHQSSQFRKRKRHVIRFTK